MAEPNRVLRLGISYDFAGLFKANAAGRDMTGLTGMLKLVSDDGDTTITRLTSDTDQWTWGTQSSGDGTWHWESNESFTTGRYKGQVFVYDGSTPVNRQIAQDDVDDEEDDGVFFYTFLDPETGSF